MLQFVNPALLIGAALFAVPLIIHLLNRQRFRRRQWAAMAFLLAAFRKQRRRLRRENLLLLLLRCLIPIILALAVARPLLRDRDALGAGDGGPTHHVLVLDQSYSMNLQLPGGTTPYERARALAAQLIDGIADEDGGARVSLVVQGLRPSVPLRESVDLQRAKARIASLAPPVDAGADLIAALTTAAELIEESTEAEQLVHVFTDLQLRAFGDGLLEPVDADDAGGAAGAQDPNTQDDGTQDDGTQDPPDTRDPDATDALFADTAPEVVRRIREHAQITVFDVRGAELGDDQVANMQLTELRLAQGHAIRNLTLPVIATVRNRSVETRSAQVTLTVDGGQPIRRSVDVEAGAEAEVEFDTSFQELGQRRLAARIQGDDLPNDDERFAVADVRERIRILVVENSPNAEYELRESTHVVEILDPTDGDGPPDLTWFDPVVVDKVSFLGGRVDPADFDLVVLANVSKLGGDGIADRLAEAVRGGTGLFAMLGEGVDPTSYNAGLYRGGRGPLPLPLQDRSGGGRGFEPGGTNHFATEVELPEHPVFDDFVDDVHYELLESVPVYRYLATDRRSLEPAPAGDARQGDVERSDDGTEEDGATRARILMSVRDAQRSPLLVASRFGAGKALFLFSPISRRPDRWNRLDSTFAGLSFMLLWPAAQWLTLPAIDPHNVTAGSELTTLLRERPTNLAVVPPETAGTAKIPIAEEAVAQPGGRYALPPFRRTDYAGFYVYELTLGADRGSDLDEQRLFAVNPAAEEGQLEYLSRERATELLGVDRVVAELPDANESAVDAGSSEFGPTLLWLTLLVLLAETAMARFVTRRRS